MAQAWTRRRGAARPLHRAGGKHPAPAWQEVPRAKLDRFEAIARAGAPELAQTILYQIRQEYPCLHLIEGESGEPMALVGIRRAIEDFVHNLTVGAHPRVPPEMFQEFGRGEGLEGRSLDALQAVYRLGPETIAVGVLMRPARETVAPAVGHGILLELRASSRASSSRTRTRRAARTS